MEICHTSSEYLEAVVLIPQFVLMYKRKAYDTWLVMYVVLAGGEHMVQSFSMAAGWRDALKEDPYRESEESSDWPCLEVCVN